MYVEQGDIIKVEKLSGNFLIVSNDYFNKTEEVILCPTVDESFSDPLHVLVEVEGKKNTVLCEQLKLIDLRSRGYSKISRISYSDIMEVTDAIQSIFDCPGVM